MTIPDDIRETAMGIVSDALTDERLGLGKIDVALQLDISQALLAERERADWRPIETSPRDYTDFLAYGSYLYPGDKGPTEYTEIVQYSGDDEWPWRGRDEVSKVSIFSHWMPLPKPPVAAAIRGETG
jgi:hypothetical protein